MAKCQSKWELIMNDKEKHCLAVAKQFLIEARQQLGFVENAYQDDTSLHSQGTMIGEIAAQKFQGCMNGPVPVPKPVARR